jgi:glutathione reductase (NADPH)
MLAQGIPLASRRRIAARSVMGDYDFDLFTIGAGSGGVRASRVSAGLGARVAIAEERALGGTCVNVGCIPKKLLVYASEFREAFEDAAGFGWQVGPRHADWRLLIERKDCEIARLNGVYADLLDDAGVTRIAGHARLVDAHTVEIEGRCYTAASILIATGGWPVVPEVPGREHGITSNEAFFLAALPERVAIVGGGYVAVEFAGILNGLGSQVTQLYRGPLFLRGFDEDARRALALQMRRAGVDLRFETCLRSIERDERGALALALDDGSTLEVDQILYAIGRRPLTDDLGIENTEIALDAEGAIVVDAYSRSSVPNIWAIGDVTNRLNLTPVAIHEGMCLANTLFGDGPQAPDHENVPRAVFGQPPLATVGLTEEEARARGAAIDVYCARFRELKHTLSGRDQQTVIKLVVERASQRVIGAHMLGPHAAEVIQGIAIAIKCGATKAQFDTTLGIHPTSAEEFVTLREKRAE